MPSPVKRFKKPKKVKIKWGKGKKNVIAYGTYKRTVKVKRGRRTVRKTKTSYAIKKLDRKRHAVKDFSKGRKVHRRYPHATDLPMSKW